MRLSFSGPIGIATRTVTETLEDAVDWHCGKCWDQGDRDRSGLTLWQVWRPTRQRQQWTDTAASVETKATETEGDRHCGKCENQRDRQKGTDTAASVETNATETEGETETRPSTFFSRGRPGGEYTANRKETIVNQNVECFTHAVPHISSIRLDLNTFRLGLCQRLTALFSPRQYL